MEIDFDRLTGRFKSLGYKRESFTAEMRIKLVIEIENKRIGIRKDIKELPKLSAGLPAVENQLQLL